MSGKFFLLLLSLPLTLQDENAKFKVTTFLEYNLDDVDTVSVICQHNGDLQWKINAVVKNESDAFCKMSNNNAQCTVSTNGNQFKFTFKNLTSAQKKQVYHCEVYRYKPLPVWHRIGEKIRLLPGFNVSCLTSPVTPDPEPTCISAVFTSISDTLSWALIGLVILLCLYSLTVTVIYIKLRIRRSEELYDTLTYVPMQVKPKKKVKRHNTEKNTEYMDMREVQAQAQPIRDMNHNSHQIPTGFTI